MRLFLNFSLLAVLSFVLFGCVERKVTIRVLPADARVMINDVDLGPGDPDNDYAKTFNFTYYGTYRMYIYMPQPRTTEVEIVKREDGTNVEIARQVSYEPLMTTLELETPWYQYLPFEPIVEFLIPWTICDYRDTKIYELKKTQMDKFDDDEKLLRRAETLRADAQKPVDIDFGHPYPLAGIMAAIVVLSFVINGF